MARLELVAATKEARAPRVRTSAKTVRPHVAPIEAPVAANEDQHKDHFITRNGLTFAGSHLIIDLWEAEGLGDRDRIEQALIDAVKEAGATLLHIHLHTFTDGGVIDAGADRGAVMLQIEGPDGHAGRLLLDATTHLPHRLTIDRSVAAGTSTVGLIITYSDYRDVSGVLLPHKILRETDTGITTTWSMAHYVVNGKISPQVFLPPRRK